MHDKLEIIKSEGGAVARPSEAPSIADILSAVVQKGISQENIGTLEKIVGLYERMEDKKAEREYVHALAALQAECQNVIATKDVDGKFRYAPFLDLWNAVRPAVERNHFTLQWSQEHQGDKIKVTLTLQHVGGHKRDLTYAMRLGSKADGMSQGSQAPTLDSITESRAKRRLLMDALNIVVDAVTAAEDVGDGTLASKEETDELFKRLVVLEADDAKRAISERRFLSLAGVDRWDQIQKLALPILQRLILEKEKAAARKGAQ